MGAVRLLLQFGYDFGRGEYDFPRFLDEVGRRPSPTYVICRKDETKPFEEGNLVWAKPARPADSPYLNVDEAAGYCRRSRKTILNHHSLGNIKSMPGTRPPLFRREELDAWLAARRKPRKKAQPKPGKK
jgi:hypothetical protein